MKININDKPVYEGSLFGFIIMILLFGMAFRVGELLYESILEFIL